MSESARGAAGKVAAIVDSVKLHRLRVGTAGVACTAQLNSTGAIDAVGVAGARGTGDASGRLSSEGHAMFYQNTTYFLYVTPSL